MTKDTILVVDDEKNIRRSIEIICGGEGYSVYTAADFKETESILSKKIVDLILLDIGLPGMDGLTILGNVKKKNPEIQCIMISGHATVENAVTATKKGAYDFIEKPIHKDKLLLTIKNALTSRALQQENIKLLDKISSRFEIIGKSAPIQTILQQIKKVAPTDGRVLILGESGTGKELIARAIHKNSHRHSAPFIKINCAAIPENLIESELFGSEKGAFTGATETRAGKFSLANGGTLFLDEVGDMSLKVQAKVLRVLQEGEFEKVGSSKTEKADVRVIAATNKNLEAEIQQGQFREDLYFRLNVIPLESPSLRQRQEDIPVLIEYFIENYCRENGFLKIRISTAAMKLLCQYDWPGNIRELRNIVERLIIMASQEYVDVTDLPSNIQSSQQKRTNNFSSPLTLKAAKEKVEKELIQSTLEKQNWNISRSAKILAIDRTNLHKKINYYQLTE